MVRVQVSVVSVLQSPVQAEKLQPSAGAAVRVTSPFRWYGGSGSAVIVPPVGGVMVRAYTSWVKVAETLLGTSMVRVQVSVVSVLQSPVQAEKLQPSAGAAVRVTSPFRWYGGSGSAVIVPPVGGVMVRAYTSWVKVAETLLERPWSGCRSPWSPCCSHRSRPRSSSLVQVLP